MINDSGSFCATRVFKTNQVCWMPPPLVISEGPYRGFYLNSNGDVLFLPGEVRPYAYQFECIILNRRTGEVFFTAAPQCFTADANFMVAPQHLQDKYAFVFGTPAHVFSNGIAFAMRLKPELFQKLTNEQRLTVLSHVRSSPSSVVQTVHPEQCVTEAEPNPAPEFDVQQLPPLEWVEAEVEYFLDDNFLASFLTNFSMDKFLDT